MIKSVVVFCEGQTVYGGQIDYGGQAGHGGQAGNRGQIGFGGQNGNVNVNGRRKMFESHDRGKLWWQKVKS